MASPIARAIRRPFNFIMLPPLLLVIKIKKQKRFDILDTLSWVKHTTP
jgi:hypothetical protein